MRKSKRNPRGLPVQVITIEEAPTVARMATQIFGPPNGGLPPDVKEGARSRKGVHWGDRFSILWLPGVTYARADDQSEESMAILDAIMVKRRLKS